MENSINTEQTASGLLVLASLIMTAAVANMNLSVANVALPSIGLAFSASQVELNLVSVGFPLGVASSVLWFGALADRYGRKMMLLLGSFWQYQHLSLPFLHRRLKSSYWHVSLVVWQRVWHFQQPCP